jgi:hypothetical protein
VLNESGSKDDEESVDDRKMSPIELQQDEDNEDDKDEEDNEDDGDDDVEDNEVGGGGGGGNRCRSSYSWLSSW